MFHDLVAVRETNDPLLPAGSDNSVLGRRHSIVEIRACSPPSIPCFTQDRTTSKDYPVVDAATQAVQAN